MDGSNKTEPLFLTSFKAKQVSHSVMGCKVMVFANAFDMADIIK